MEHATELQAALHTIHLRSPDPLAMARFYSRAYGMSLDAGAGGYACCRPGRPVQISRGPVKQLGFAQFMLHSDAAWQALRQRVRAPAQAPLPAHCAAGGAGGGGGAVPRRGPGGQLIVFYRPRGGGGGGGGAAVAWRDPDGNLIVFTAPGGGAAPGPDAGLPAAMLQHFALRTPQLPQMLAFYTGQLGLVLSDLVRDPEGRLRACFLRSDPLHHALALFLAPMACFDHLSFEVPDWACMKTWGDHMAPLRQPILFGLGLLRPPVFRGPRLGLHEALGRPYGAAARAYRLGSGAPWAGQRCVLHGARPGWQSGRDFVGDRALRTWPCRRRMAP